MKTLLMVATIFGFCATGVAQAQTGWERPIGSYVEASKTDMPKINRPEPGWEKVRDVQFTDGTATVPPCDDSSVIASVRAGMLEVANKPYKNFIQKNGSIGKQFMQPFTKVDIDDIWVHSTYSDRYVCSTTVTIPESSDIGRNKWAWKFQTFAEDGKQRVFFYNVEDQLKK